MDLNFIKEQIDRSYPKAHVRLMQFGPSQRLDIEIEGAYFVLETDPDEEGIAFSQVQPGKLDFSGHDEILYADGEQTFRRVFRTINKVLKSSGSQARTARIRELMAQRNRAAVKA